MTKKQKLSCYKKLQEYSDCLLDAGKDRLKQMVFGQDIHEFDAIMIILEQHQDLIDPNKRGRLAAALNREV